MDPCAGQPYEVVPTSITTSASPDIVSGVVRRSMVKSEERGTDPPDVHMLAAAPVSA